MRNRTENRPKMPGVNLLPLLEKILFFIAPSSILRDITVPAHVRF